MNYVAANPHRHFIYRKWVATLMIASAFTGGGISLLSLGSIQLYPLRVFGFIVLPFLLFKIFRTPIGFKQTSLTIWTLAFTLAWGTISLFWSPDILLGVRALAILATGVTLACWTIYYAKNSEERIFNILRWWCIFSIPVSSIGYYELITKTHLFTYVDSIKVDAADRAAVLMGWLPPQAFTSNWNNFAFINALSLFVMLGTALAPATKRLRPLATLACLLLVGLIGSSLSRAAVGGTAIGISLYVFAFLGTNKKSNSFPKHPTIFVIIAISALLYLSLKSGSIIDYVFDFLIQKNERFEGLGEREFYYTKAIESVATAYGLGGGLGASTVIIAGGSYHNHFLELLAELGPFVFLLHAVMHLKLIWMCMANAKNSKWGPLFLSIAVSGISLPILVMGPSSTVVEPIYWLWLGLSSLLVATIEKKHGHSNRRLNPNNHVSAPVSEICKQSSVIFEPIS